MIYNGNLRKCEHVRQEVTVVVGAVHSPLTTDGFILGFTTASCHGYTIARASSMTECGYLINAVRAGGEVNLTERTQLEVMAVQVTDLLTKYFGAEQTADSGMVSKVERVDVVVDPVPGLVVQVRHWSLPDGRVLDIFVPALGALGLLSHNEFDPDPSHYNIFPFIHLREQLSTRAFAAKWTTAPNGHLAAPLYEATDRG